MKMPTDLRREAEEYAKLDQQKAWKDAFAGNKFNGLSQYNRIIAAYESGHASALGKCLAVVVRLKEHCRECQMEKENAGENEKPDFIRHSILWDVEKELRCLLPASGERKEEGWR